MSQAAVSAQPIESPQKTSNKASKSSLDIAPAELALEVKNLCVSFRNYESRPSSLKEHLLRCVKERRLKFHSEFEVLKNLSFNVKRGEVFAIIGSNGAGKTTLLRSLVGVLPPKSGSIEAHGRIDSLIQLGAGFDQELNAIENIYLNASLYQISKAQMAPRVKRIIDFAELEEFAHTPIKYYSSGMSARLGFSVAIDREPDILIVDEVLGVGDARFREKCTKVFDSLLERKKTIVMVSHGLGQVKSMAHRCLLLSKGEIQYLGDPKTAIDLYKSSEYKTRLASDK